VGRAEKVEEREEEKRRRGKSSSSYSHRTCPTNSPYFSIYHYVTLEVGDGGDFFSAKRTGSGQKIRKRVLVRGNQP
jgi:hypothetical protein